MKINTYLLISCLIPSFLLAQNDYSANWSDLYSYNNVKDFSIVENNLVAITENAMFITDLDNNETRKFSSVDGLSGGTTSTIGFDEVSETTLIGYEDGLVELISKNEEVLPLTGVRDNSILLDKEVKGFYIQGDYSYAYGDFGIVELSISDGEYGDSYRLERNGFPTSVSDVLVLDEVLYAATAIGLYSIDLSLGLQIENFNNWTELSLINVNNIVEYKGQVLFSNANVIRIIENINTAFLTVSDNIEYLSIDSSSGRLVVTMSELVDIYEDDILYDQINLADSETHTISTSKVIVNDNHIYVGTDSNGVLVSDFSDRTNYIEIHPEGPSENDVFSATASNGNVWFSYGGYDSSYGFSGNRKGVSGFYEGSWYNIPYSILEVRDITKIEINPKNSGQIYAASYYNGVALLQYDDQARDWSKKEIWNPDTTNNGIQDLTVFDAVISYLSLDNNDQLWVNSLFSVDNEFLSRYNFETEEWETHVNFSDFFNSPPYNDIRLINTFFDEDGTGFCGTKQSGLVVFKENHDENLLATNDVNKINVINSTNSNLSSLNVRAIVSDDSNGIWVGTPNGVFTLRAADLFDTTEQYSFDTVIIEENGEAREFLADIQINDILIDNAGNKWFGTNGSGLFYTSSDAQTTFETFKTGNSPLPSDIIYDLELDTSTGIIYIVTEKGVVAYDPQNEPFGTSVTEVIAYPNPAIRNVSGHEEITIVAKNGEGIPEGTNVKIMDVSGRLVYETNVGSDSSAIGGKVVWDKRNLSGNYVVSGVYIVLLSSQDTTETTTTKIAIVN